ncbi:MAG TPA: hypothetical protein PLX20_13470 [Rhodocyclaceae bacterium]|nr:hypothetical protein [Rhodocyclaceae bacterium]HMV54560.1 hypothetical protein [Rhodocyclaceae bacterium]HMZ83853.1 hypothetical protein [Rhodocyclaceae bacterium]HNB78664.1 hypothetical protein [Rhodocyclaceae bacterium]HNH14142.1 hypothetical protein [Rhodocyclaceae bacterium]
MITRNRGIAITVGSLMLAGCTSSPDAPVPVVPALTVQTKTQALVHWESLSNDLADGIAQDLGSDATRLPVFIETRENSTYAASLREMLQARLARNGLVVATRADGARRLSLQTRLVAFREGRSGARVAPDSGHLQATGGTPAHEVLTTLAVVDGSNYRAQRQAIHYIDDAEAGLYRSTVSRAKTLNVVGPTRGGAR